MSLQRFEELLAGYKALWLRRPEKLSRLRSLLGGFAEQRRGADAATAVEVAQERRAVGTLLAGFRSAVVEDDRRQTLVADDFNILEVLNLVGKELRHSMALAWLLDRDRRNFGTHAQGSLGFRLFLEEFHIPLHYAELPYWVRREVTGNESRVDVEVACAGHFLIHIENKIWAAEGTRQTEREWEDLLARAAWLSIDTSATPSCLHGLFLTPGGEPPTDGRFRAISWGGVARILDAFADQAKPADVKLFATHYARTLRRFIVMQTAENGGGHGQGPAE
jgi:hypothetical protein